MKNLLNLKGLCRSSQLAVDSDGRTTVERRSNDGYSQRHLPVGLTKLLSLFLLLTLGVGNAWADEQMGFQDSDNGVKFSKSIDGGSSYSDYPVSHGRTNTTQDGGSVTNLYLKEYFVYLYQNVDKLTGTTHVNYWFYRTNIGKGEDVATQFGGNWGNWKVDTQDDNGWENGWRHPKFGNDNISNDGGTTNVNLLSGQGSGHYTFEYYFDAETNGGWSTLYCSNTNSENFKVTFTYNIVPAVSSYAYSTTGSSSILSGSGTSEDPYIISYNGSLKITQSGSKASSDANSDPYYKFGDGAYGTSAYTTISNITSTSKTSIEVKMKYYNSIDDLSGTESIATIYYKAEPAYTVTVNNDGHGTTTPSGAQSNVGQLSGIAISATNNTGYAFENWTITSGTGSFTGGGTISTSASTTFFPTSAATIQANFRSTATPMITGLSLSATLVTKGNTFTATPTIDTGDGRTIYICWEIQDSEGTALDPQPSIQSGTGNSVTITAPSTSGNYKVVATLREGTGCGGTILDTDEQSFTVQGSYTVSISNGQVAADNAATNVTAGEVTTGTAYANNAAEGKKFVNWTWTPADKLTLSECEATDRSITFNASANVTLTATYTDRSTKKVYFASPGGWDDIYAYVWNSSNGDDKNETFPGVEITSNTEVVNCVPYYYYEFYDEPNGTGDAGHPDWDRVIFNKGTGNSEYPNANWDKTKNLNISDGNYYRAYEGANSTGRTDGHDWYLEGTFNGDNHWDFSHPIAIDCETGIGYVDVADLTATSQSFKIYQASTNTWYSGAGMTVGVAATLSTPYGANCTVTPAAAGTHRFTFNTGTKELTIRYAGADPDLSATIRTDGTNGASVSSVSVLHQYTPTVITATVPTSYRFAGWTSTGGGTVTFADASSATTTVTATSSGAVITAEFTNEGVIYLDKSAISSKWSGTPYVYFYSGAYWNNDAGAGSKTSSTPGVPGTCISASNDMTRIGDSQIWYYDYSALLSAGTSRQYIAFVDNSNQTNHEWFDACSVIYRGDFYPNSSMFVVQDYTEYKNIHNNVKTAYYNKGYWRKYNDTDPGYVVKIYNNYANATCTGTYHFSSAEPGARNCTADVPLHSGTTYFKIVGCDTTTVNSVNYAGTYYRDGSNGTMNTDNCTNWLLTDESGSNTGVLATASSDYTFTLTLGEGQMFISVEFPLTVGDFRMVYNGKMRSTDGSKKDHPSNFIRKLKAPTVASDTTKRDTISFYVDPANTPEIRFQWCSKIDGYTITWRDTLASSKPTLSSITKAGVYNFEIVQTTTNAEVHTINCALLGAYKGNYYIRTDKAAGGWKTYKEVKDNQLVYSNISRQYDFDYYYCNWFNAGDNVKFTIANDYNECVTDTVENDTYVNQTDGNEGKLSYSANIRFMFNDSTNVIGRAYINGSKDNNRYLVLTGDTKVFDKNGNTIPASSPLNANELEFDDQNNWVYQVDLKAQSGAQVDVTATYNGNVQSFINDQVLVTSTSGETDEQYPLRVVYDFKTNHLVTAWLPPTTTIGEDLSVAADMMLIRHGQNAAQELIFDDGSIKNIHTMIGAMEFRRDSIVGHVGSFTNETSENKTYRYMMYYISFPFDVAVQDIYGCGQFNREWYLQYYDGADRAAKGFFRGDGTTTFWKFMSLTDTLKAGTGYSLLLDNDYFNTAGENVWTNNPEMVYLYFPSATILHADSVISSTTKTLQIPAHECRHDRTFFTESGREVNHKFTDSHWNMMGVPLFQNYNASIASFAPGTPVDSTAALAEGKGYFYDWSPVNNTFTIHAADNYQFKSMHGYMVQFNGPVSFTGSAIHTKPSPVVARRTPLNREDYTLELQLLRNNNRVSRTYIELREEACDTFALNEDVYMLYTSLPADLFTFAGNYDVSANVLSIDNHVVPVGVEVHQTGEYTFAMPDNFSGSAVLVDTEANTRTNLAISDYTVTLPKGVSDGRFFLELDINKMPTAIDGVTDGSGSLKDGKSHKFIENGVLYIVKDGQVFDARGNKVK